MTCKSMQTWEWELQNEVQKKSTQRINDHKPSETSLISISYALWYPKRSPYNVLL